MKKIQKTTSKHLVLDKETIRDLLSHELTQAAGGQALQPLVTSAATGCTTHCPM